MLAARSLALPAQYKQQPLFCFETMMHMLYWSCLAYEHKRVSLQRIHAKLCQHRNQLLAAGNNMKS